MASFTPWGVPLTTWKALLDPMAPGGNYTVVADCTAGCDAATTHPVNISNVAFGDVWCVCCWCWWWWVVVFPTRRRSKR